MVKNYCDRSCFHAKGSRELLKRHQATNTGRGGGAKAGAAMAIRLLPHRESRKKELKASVI